MYECITSRNGKDNDTSIFNDRVIQYNGLFIPKKDQTAKLCCCIKKSQSYFIGCS